MERLQKLSLLAGFAFGVVTTIGVATWVTRKSPPPSPVVEAAPTPPVAALPTRTQLQHRRRARVAKASSAPDPRPLWQQGTIQVGDGTIFSGADPKDPRIYHLTEQPQ